jgi:hypothetical protein
MRKLQLDLAALRVETFDTVAAEGGEGTVFGAALTDGCQIAPAPASIFIACTAVQTCKVTCDDATCAHSCFQTGCATCLITCNPSCNWCLNP